MKKNRKMLAVILVTYIVFLIILMALILPAVMDVFSYELVRHMDVETLILVMFFLVTFISLLIFKLANLYNRDDDIQKKSIYLDEERSYLESQINEINRKLVATDERWKEAYHLIISSQTKQADLTGKISTEKFLDGFGVDVSDVKVQGNLAFVLTPFHYEFDRTYQLIRDVCEQVKMTAVRGDETFVKNDILKHIIKHIVKARVVIANLDGRNPNVFYELGIAHALNKPTILIANVETQIPVDINNQYLILYQNEEQLREKLSETILKVLTVSN